MPRDKLVILFWDETLNDGQGGWVEVPSYFSEQGRRINAFTKKLGIYVLAIRDRTCRAT
jgi:hypothetical protein